MEGWIKLYRKIWDSWLWQERRKFSKAEAWIDLLLMANHKDNEVLIGNKLVKLKRGQLITSEVKLSTRWQWSRDRVRRFLSLLEEEGMITKESDRNKTTITIENYGLYQDGNTTDKTTNDTTDRQPTDNQQDTNKNDKNEKNDKKDIDNTRRKQRRVYDEDSPYYKMAVYFREKIEENVPGYIFRGNIQTWADDFRKIHEIDGRTKQEIKEVIDWVTQDDFWQDNVQSPSKLRKQFHVLMNRMRKEGGGGRGVGYQGHYGSDRKDETPVINFGKYANFGRRVGI